MNLPASVHLLYEDSCGYPSSYSQKMDTNKESPLSLTVYKCNSCFANISVIFLISLFCHISYISVL